MQRITLFLTLTIVSLISLVAVVTAGYFILTSPNPSSTPQSNWMGQMWSGMGGMMGGNSGTQAPTQNAAAPYLGVAFIVLVAVAVVGVGGLLYFIAFPELKIRQHAAQPVRNTEAQAIRQMQAAATSYEGNSTPYDSVLKTLTADERRVVEVLGIHGGKYLQKYIRKEVNLSRLQTHRIVARLADRGVVTVEKTGNTNTVLLADWLKKPI
ncbi:MAG: helix-turn-helix transcriptional regulator [Candidatus Bathyarchaeia archaeon]